MAPSVSKRAVRMENKKKKLAALVEISKLNEHDRILKLSRTTDAVSGKMGIIETEPIPKRPRTSSESEGTVSAKVRDTQLNHSSLPDNNSPVEIGRSGKPKLEGEEYLQLKQKLKDNAMRAKLLVLFRLRDMGESASLDVDAENRVPLFITDLQHLIMYSQVGHHSPYSPARWCALNKFNRLQSTSVLIIEDVSMQFFCEHRNLFPFLDSTFKHKLEVLSPYAYKADIVQELLMVPLTSTQMTKFVSEYGDLQKAVVEGTEVFDCLKNLFPMEDKEEKTDSNLPSGDKFSRTQLLLSGWQMVEENFPLPIKGLMEKKYVGYVLTKDKYKDVTASSPMFALDCEMCKTTIMDLEVTRVSIVDEENKVVYEQLVKPDNKITDYLTQFSGITPKMMKNVTKRLEEVQKDLREILPPDAILIGQSLNGDLHALKMMHPYIIDTSVIYNITGDRARKTKLQTLSREFLNETIQDSKGGHCSVEDSIACMKLVKHKLQKYLYYGDAVMGGMQEHIKRQQQHQPEMATPTYATNLLKQVTRFDKTASVVAASDIIERYNFYTFKQQESSEMCPKLQLSSKKTNEGIIKKACKNVTKHSLNVAHIKVPSGQAEKEETLLNIDNWVKQLYESMPTPGLSLVMLGGRKEAANGLCFIQMKNLL